MLVTSPQHRTPMPNYDGAYHRLLSTPDMVQDLLQNILPEDLAREFDLSTSFCTLLFFTSILSKKISPRVVASPQFSPLCYIMARFGVYPPHLSGSLHSVQNIDTLDELLTLAATTPALPNFQAGLKQKGLN